MVERVATTCLLIGAHLAIGSILIVMSPSLIVIPGLPSNINKGKGIFVSSILDARGIAAGLC